MNTLRTFLVLILFTTIIAWSPLKADDDEQTRQCRELLQQGKYSEAIECLREQARSDKRNSATYLLLGTALLEVDSVDQAVAELIKAREIDSANAAVYEKLGDAYSKQIPAAAVSQYEKATQLDSTSPALFLKLARTHMKLRQYNQAAVAYLKVIALDSNNVDSYRDLGNLYIRANQYENAIPLLEQLVARDTGASKERVQLVKAYYNTRRYEALIPMGRAIVDKDSSDADIIRYLGYAYARTKDNENAELIFAMLARRDSMRADDFVEMAKAQKTLDKTDEAILSYERAFALDSALCDIFYDVGSLYMKKKMYREAVEMFDRKVACDTSSGYRFASQYNAALCLMQLKEFEEARTKILASIEQRPEYVPSWSALASCFMQMDSSLKAREAYLKLIELVTGTNGDPTKYSSQLEEAYRMVGVQLLLDKKYPQSVDYLKKALQFKPKDCELMLWIAQANHNSNNKEEAKKYYCRILELCGKVKDGQLAKDAQKGLDLLGMECGN